MTRLLFLAPIALSACIADPLAIESPEVTLSTPQGPVICQLYTARQTLYDEAVRRPANMTDAAANAACKEEGKRRQAELLGR